MPRAPPTDPAELFLEEVWPSDEAGLVDGEILKREPKRAMWVNTDHIDRLEILDPQDGD